MKHTTWLAACGALAASFANAQTVPGQPFPAQTARTFANPIDVRIADPFVLLNAGTYYLYGTSNPGEGFDVWTSIDLAHWQASGAVYRRSASTWAQRDFWAPCVVRDEGRYLLYYNAQRDEKQGHRICVAQASSPLGPFTDVRAPLWEPGYAVIDAHVFRDMDMRAYLYYSRDISQHPVSETWVIPLGTDLVTPGGEARLCVAPSAEWEGRWNEAPLVVRHRDRYVLFYSGPEYTSPGYSVGYAVSSSPLGPWTKPFANPVLGRMPWVSGPGHPCITTSPDGREMWMVYHVHEQGSGGGPRVLAADRMRLLDDAQFGVRVEVDGPSLSTQELASGARGPLVAPGDEFEARELDRTRWTIVNEDPGAWRMEKGRLVITTQDGDLWQSRYDLRNLFLQAAPSGDFEAITRTDYTVSRNFDQVMLVAWGDHNSYVRLSNVYSGGRRWQVTRELGGEVRTFETPNTLGDAVWMKLTRRGRTIQFAVSGDGSAWYPVGPPLLTDFAELAVGVSASSPGSGRRGDAGFEFFRVSRGEASRARLTP